MDRDNKPVRRRQKRHPRSEDALAELAVAYLQRFPCTEAKLRRHLDRKLKDAAREGVAVEDAGAWLDAVIARMKRARLLDDRAWAEGRTRVLMARGRPRRVIERDLITKGVPAELAQQALDDLAERQANPELAAACNYARRRRLGPWAREGERAAKRHKHLGALARAGFSFALARQIIDAEDVAELVDALERG